MAQHCLLHALPTVLRYAQIQAMQSKSKHSISTLLRFPQSAAAEDLRAVETQLISRYFGAGGGTRAACGASPGDFDRRGSVDRPPSYALQWCVSSARLQVVAEHHAVWHAVPCSS